MILEAGSIHWNAGIDVVVEGDAVQVTDEGLLKRLVAVWATKWDGRWDYEIRTVPFTAKIDDPSVLGHAHQGLRVC